MLGKLFRILYILITRSVDQHVETSMHVQYAPLQLF
jgi:hypothetical protein